MQYEESRAVRAGCGAMECVDPYRIAQAMCSVSLFSVKVSTSVKILSQARCSVLDSFYSLIRLDHLTFSQLIVLVPSLLSQYSNSRDLRNVLVGISSVGPIRSAQSLPTLRSPADKASGVLFWKFPKLESPRQRK